MSIEKILEERGSNYGSFEEHAAIVQQLKHTCYHTPSWPRLEDDQKEALEMILHKIGRILNGNPNYIDSWTDIIGYTKLVETRLKAAEAGKEKGEGVPGVTSNLG
jgi:hypothetical protein